MGPGYTPTMATKKSGPSLLPLAAFMILFFGGGALLANAEAQKKRAAGLP